MRLSYVNSVYVRIKYYIHVLEAKRKNFYYTINTLPISIFIGNFHGETNRIKFR